ncbi:hypothetical protein NC651_038331 [Populus alba x Populus x berolinensis]|nr:hypothetical protein NC651_038331 [Populus alba x Populus x berolinensis]
MEAQQPDSREEMKPREDMEVKKEQEVMGSCKEGAGLLEKNGVHHLWTPSYCSNHGSINSSIPSVPKDLGKKKRVCRGSRRCFSSFQGGQFLNEMTRNWQQVSSHQGFSSLARPSLADLA